MSCIAVSVRVRTASGSTWRNVRPPGPSTVKSFSGMVRDVLLGLQLVEGGGVGPGLPDRDPAGGYAAGDGRSDVLQCRAAEALARTRVAQQARGEQAGDEPGHERVAGPDGVDDPFGCGRGAALLSGPRH